MIFKQFQPKYYINTDDGEQLHVMLAFSKEHGEQVAYSVRVDQDTGRYLGNIVESRLRAGYNDALYFQRNRQRYYLSWLKRFPKRVDKK